jgi:shikimate kinase
MGSGKTHFGNQLAGAWGCPFFDTDLLIEQQQGMSITEIFERQGENAFRQMEANLIRQYAWPERSVISCGGGLPCFFDNMAYLLGKGTVVWLNPPVEVIAARLWGKPATRPLVAHALSQADLVLALRQLMAKRQSYYALAHHTLPQQSPTPADLEGLLQEAVGE